MIITKIPMCPNTRRYLHDPVIGSGGHIYEKDAIVTLFQQEQDQDIADIPINSIGVKSIVTSSVLCFAGWCSVKLKNGEKSLNDIRKGDMVQTAEGFSKVLCVVKTWCKDMRADLVEIGVLSVTPYHPVMVDNMWVYPITVGKSFNRSCSAVYSFLLENHHTMIIEGITCICLAHERKDGILEHPYFGTQAIVDDLQKMNGWECGFIELNAVCIKTTKSGTVSGLIQ